LYLVLSGQWHAAIGNPLANVAKCFLIPTRYSNNTLGQWQEVPTNPLADFSGRTETCKGASFFHYFCEDLNFQNKNPEIIVVETTLT
jgi:hypothetical protein